MGQRKIIVMPPIENQINMPVPNKSAEIQAFLFYYGDPISKHKLAKHLGLKDAECADELRALSSELKDNSSSGLVIFENGDDVQLVTKPEFSSLAHKLIQNEFKEELTPAVLETLAIIAYIGPVPRSSIDYIRGVNSSFIIRNLMMRGLIERDLSATKGNWYYYRVTFEFLKHLGLPHIENLPEFEKYKKLLTAFESQESVSNITPETTSQNEKTE